MTAAPARLLVAYPDEPFRSLLRLILADEGYCVTTAGTVDEACCLLHQHTFDLVIADGFQFGRGPGLAQGAAILQAAGMTPVLLCAAYPATHTEACEAGYRGLVSTDCFDIERLLTQVSDVLADPCAPPASEHASPHEVQARIP